MRLRRLAPALAAAAALAACERGGQPPAAQPSPSPTPRPLALVDGEPIAPAALARSLREAGLGAADGGSPDPALRSRILQAAVDRVLLLREARRRQVAATPAEVDAAVARLRGEYPGAHFAELLAREELTEPALRARLAEQLTVEKLLLEHAYPAVRVGDDEVERYYREHRQEFDEPPRVHASQIVVRSREEAQRLRRELRRHPARFAEVARRASVAPEAARGGDLGWFGKDSGMPEVFDACLTLPVNQLSAVTASPYGFHLFKVLARRPARRRPLAEVSGVIRAQLLREGRARAQEAFLAALRGRARIEVNERALDAMIR